MRGSQLLIFLSTLGAALSASAHHSALIFDQDSVVAFRGTIIEFSWKNPHVYIRVANADEGAVEWEIETDATPILTRSGWTRDALAPGDTVLVRVHPDRDPTKRHALLMSLEKADGTVLAPRSYFLHKADDPAVESSTDTLAGVWELGFADYANFYTAWKKVALTDKGVAARDRYDVRLDSPEAQCIPMPTPGLLVAPYLNEIVLGKDRILFRNERYNLERTIYMDGRGHPVDGTPTNQGHSIGHWDGDTLVVDTVQFASHRSQILGTGVPSGPDKHVVERYTLSEDGTAMTIDFRLEDPDYLAEPFVGRVVWHYAPQFQMLGFNCDPESSSRYTRE